MSSAVSSYIATLLIYLGVNGIACWALNLQFGVGGVMNFAFIIYQSVGAYITAVLTLPSDRSVPDETYILGWHLPWPLPLVGAAIAGALLALAVGSFALRPRRRDFQATVMLVVSIIAAALVSTEQGWFNGNQGLFGIPQPFASSLSLSISGYDWFFVGIAAAIAAIVWFLTARLVGSPWGRRLRAMRENAEAVESLGTNTRKESLKVYVIGGAVGALSGGLLVEFIAGWSTARGAQARPSSTSSRSSSAASGTASARSSARSLSSACSLSCPRFSRRWRMPTSRSRCSRRSSAC